MKILMHYGQINHNIHGYTVQHTGLGPLIVLRTIMCGMCEPTDVLVVGGYYYGYYDCDSDDNRGVRPVITIDISKI